MNNLDDIKDILLEDFAVQKVKEYSINKNKLKSYFYIGKKIECACKEENINIDDISLKLQLGIQCYDVSFFKDVYLFYLLVNNGMEVSYYLSWNHYKELIKLEDVKLINFLIHLCVLYDLTLVELKKVIKYKKYNNFSESIKNNILDRNISNIDKIISDSIFKYSI